MKRAIAFARREDGSIVLISMVGLITLTLMIILVLNTGFQLTRRIQVQNAADAHAMTQASWTARSMNVMAMNQVGMTQSMAVSVTAHALVGLANEANIFAALALVSIAQKTGAACSPPYITCIPALLHALYTGISAGVGIDDSIRTLDMLDFKLTTLSSEIGNDFSDIAVAFSKMNEHIVEEFPEFAAQIAEELAAENSVETPLFYPRKESQTQRVSTALPVEVATFNLFAPHEQAALCQRGLWGTLAPGLQENFESHGYAAGQGPYAIARDFLSKRISRPIKTSGFAGYEGGFVTGLAQAGRPLLILQHHQNADYLYPANHVDDAAPNENRTIVDYTEWANLFNLLPQFIQDFANALPPPPLDLGVGVLIRNAAQLPPAKSKPPGRYQQTSTDNKFRPKTSGKLNVSFRIAGIPGVNASADNLFLPECVAQRVGGATAILDADKELKLYSVLGGNPLQFTNEERHRLLSLVAFAKRDGGAGIFENNFPSAFDESYAYAQARVYNVSHQLNRYGGGQYVNPLSEINAYNDLWTQGWRARLTPATRIVEDKTEVAAAVAEYAALEGMFSAMTEDELRYINVR